MSQSDLIELFEDREKYLRDKAGQYPKPKHTAELKKLERLKLELENYDNPELGTTVPMRVPYEEPGIVDSLSFQTPKKSLKFREYEFELLKWKNELLHEELQGLKSQQENLKLLTDMLCSLI